MSSQTHSRDHRNDIERRKRGFVAKVLQRKKLEGVFLFVTSRCNSKCRTCFYHSKLNDDRDLTFEELRTVSRTAPQFDKLWLSGGEPTMRKDLVEIVRLFHEQNGIKVVNFPTNGLLVARKKLSSTPWPRDLKPLESPETAHRNTNSSTRILLKISLVKLPKLGRVIL